MFSRHGVAIGSSNPLLASNRLLVEARLLQSWVPPADSVPPLAVANHETPSVCRNSHPRLPNDEAAFAHGPAPFSPPAPIPFETPHLLERNKPCVALHPLPSPWADTIRSPPE